MEKKISEEDYFLLTIIKEAGVRWCNETWKLLECELQDKRLLSDKSVIGALNRVGNDYCWNFFCDMVERLPMTKSAYKNGLRHAWVYGRGEGDWRADEMFIKVGLQNIMNAKERKIFEGLPEMLTIYRGCNKIEFETKCFSNSWTWRRDVAEYFAFRGKGCKEEDGSVFSAVINKNDIWALLEERNEHEIVCPPCAYDAEKVKLVTDKRTEYYREYADFIEKRTWNVKTNSVG